MAAESPRATAKRRQIAAAARQLFLSDGYSRTTMDAVTEAAGVSKQTLYAYFPGKEELLREVLIDELQALVPPPRVEHITSLAELRDLLVRLATGMGVGMMTEERVALMRLLIGEAVHVPALRSLAHDALPGRLLAIVTALLAQAHDDRVAVVPRPELHARLFLGPVMTFVALDGWLFSGAPKPPSAEQIDYIVDAFLRTLEVPA